MNPEIAAVLRRGRRAATFFAFAWIASPATLVSLLFASETFPALRLSTKTAPDSFVALLVLAASPLVCIARPVFVYALWNVAARTGQATFHPVVLAFSALALPWIAFFVSVRRATAGLKVIDGREDTTPPAWALELPGPLLVIPVGDG